MHTPQLRILPAFDYLSCNPEHGLEQRELSQGSGNQSRVKEERSQRFSLDFASLFLQPDSRQPHRPEMPFFCTFYQDRRSQGREEESSISILDLVGQGVVTNLICFRSTIYLFIQELRALSHWPTVNMEFKEQMDRQ